MLRGIEGSWDREMERWGDGNQVVRQRERRELLFDCNSTFSFEQESHAGSGWAGFYWVGCDAVHAIRSERRVWWWCSFGQTF